MLINDGYMMNQPSEGQTEQYNIVKAYHLEKYDATCPRADQGS